MPVRPSPFILPAHPTLRDRPPKGESWVHEVRFDGYWLQLKPTRTHIREAIDATSLDRMGHFFRDVKGLGNVAVSRHAEDRMRRDNIAPETFESVLLSPARPDRMDGMDILWREGKGIRIVILIDPTPNVGAKLVKTVYRVTDQASAKIGSLRFPSPADH